MTERRMTSREICEAMALTFEQELNTSKAIYVGLPKAQFDEIGVVVVKAKAVEMLVDNLRILRGLLPPDNEPQIVQLREHRKEG